MTALARRILVLFLTNAFAFAVPAVSAVSTAETAIPQRVANIAAMLDATPRGLGIPITDRDAWNRFAEIPGFRSAAESASELLVKPVPDLPDTLFLQFTRSGNRVNYESPYFTRRTVLGRLVLAECLESRGRFLDVIELYIRAICSEPTWMLPAHDRELKNYRGEAVQVDLFVAETSWTLATVDHLLQDRLSPDVRMLLRKEVRRRTFDPVLRILRDGESAASWMTTTNNWNAVCFGGVVGAALALVESQEERAWFIYGAEKYTTNFFAGFTSDGYCSEGLGYWNYGFGHYLMLAVAVSRATGGRLDPLDREKVSNIARFPVNIEIIPGVYPAFADCPVTARPTPRFMRFLSRRYGFGSDRWNTPSDPDFGRHFYELVLFDLTGDIGVPEGGNGEGEKYPVRHWFEDAGVLICRPPEVVQNGLGAALKGGHNNEHHNHNDLGSFVVALKEKALIVDPGAEVYTARTFSSRRYESSALKSFGHSVPVVAGKLQRTGAEAKAVVVGTNFTESHDRVIFDLSSAYDVPTLRKLERTLDYSRAGRCALTVTDRVEFSSPERFETALVTFSEWRETSPGVLTIQDGAVALNVKITVSGSGFRITSERIDENMTAKKQPVRIGIVLEKPVRETVVTMTIRSE